ALVPTIETGTGVVHIYVDQDADLAMAEKLVVNAKTRRPSVCNTVETVLIHKNLADTFLPALSQTLQMHGVVMHGDLPGIVPATEEDWSTEYLSLDVAIKL